MRILHHCLGAIAKTNLALWRYRVNFVPLNVIALGVLAFVGFQSFTATIDALANSGAPPEVSLAEIRLASMSQHYVRVAGMAIPEAVFEFGDKDSNGTIKNPERVWFLLMDEASGRVLLVQHRGRVQGTAATNTTLVGTLRPLDPEVKRSMAATGFQLQGHPVESTYMLVEGETPGSASFYAVVNLLILACLGAAAIVIIKRHVIFEPSGSVPAAAATPEPAAFVRVSATGRFTLDGKTRQRFVDMPAVMNLHEGAPVIASNIDASKRFMGVTTSKRAGVWTIAVRAGSVTGGEYGHLYFGTSRRLAFRFTYTDAADGTQMTAVVTADEAATLQEAVRMLTTRRAVSSAPPLQATA